MNFFVILFLCAGQWCVAAPLKSAIVVRGDTNEIVFDDDADAVRHPASLTKKMTLYLLFEALHTGHIHLQTQFPVSSLAQNQIPSKIDAKAGEWVSVENIIKALVVKSANDMAVVAAEGLGGSVTQFAAIMNQKARDLGMNNTHFTNASGVPDHNQTTTARDMVILARALYDHFPQFWPYFQTRQFTYNGKIFKTHNKLLDQYPGTDGIKTGFISMSGFNISTSVVRHNASGEPIRLFVVVMGGDTSKERDKRVMSLMDNYFQRMGMSGFLKAPQRKNKPSSTRQDTNIQMVLQNILDDHDKPAKQLTVLKKKSPSKKGLLKPKKKVRKT